VHDPGSPRLAQPQSEEIPVDTHAKDSTAVLGFTMPTIDGKSEPLEKYAGKVVLMVNVASKCGLTPQYEALEKVYENYKDKGFVVLGFPANNFGGQEPGTDKQIKAFCTGTYDVSFPMFSKISVLGKDQHPLYKKLAKAMHEQGGDPTWNFTKYLIDRTGHVVARFDPRTTPDDPKLLEAIEKLLAVQSAGEDSDADQKSHEQHAHAPAHDGRAAHQREMED